MRDHRRGASRRPPQLDPGQRRRAVPRAGDGAAAGAAPPQLPSIPIFLLADRKVAGTVTVEVATLADEFVWLLDDTAAFIAGRVDRRRWTATSTGCCRRSPRRSPAMTGSASTPGRRPGTRAVSPSSSRPSAACSSTSTARTSSAPTWASSAPRSAPCSATAARSARASATPPACSARTAPTRCSTAPRRPTGPSCRPASATPRSRSATATATSPSSRAWRSPAASRSSSGRRAIASGSSGRSRRPSSSPAAIAEAIAAQSRWCSRAAAARPVYAVVTNCTYDGMCYDAASVQERLAQERRPHSLRRSLVRLRAVQPDVPRALRDARRPGRPSGRRPDGLRHALHAQAARGAVADVVHPHPRRPRRHRSRTVQRGLLLAGRAPRRSMRSSPRTRSPRR